MKRIEKKAEPKCLAEYKRKYQDKSKSAYESLDGSERNKLKECLLKEQFYLCCYCMIGLEPNNSHIEHLKPQSRYPKDSLLYENILASCNSKENCGNKKSGWWEDNSFLSPLEETCENSFQYSFDGRIVPLNQKAKKTVDVLNLNSYRLTRARKAAISIIDNLSIGACDEVRYCFDFYSVPTDQGKLPGFAPVLVFFLKKLMDNEPVEKFG